VKAKSQKSTLCRPEIFFAVIICTVMLLIAWSIPQKARADDYRPISINWEIAAPGANTDAITDITWGNRGEACRVTVQVATSSIANLMVTRGGTENALGLNANSALVAGAVYTFDIHGMQSADTVNFQVETDSIIDTLAIGSMRLTR